MFNVFSGIKKIIGSSSEAEDLALGKPSNYEEIAAIKYFDGLHVKVHRGDIISEHISRTGTWEDDLSKKLIALGESGGLMVDVGANLGYFSLLWAKSNPKNTSYAFEASPRIFPMLASSIETNKLSSQIFPFAVALGNQSQFCDFVLGPHEQTGWGGLALRPDGLNTTKVISLKLDDLLQGQDIKVLKIDVEGADTWVLHGCKTLLETKKIKHIFYEQNYPRMAELGIEPEEAGNFLKELGYCSENITTLEDDVVEWHASAT